ncbi:MAG TPA: AAA family ATPase, partial [Anaerolineae bacterium]
TNSLQESQRQWDRIVESARQFDQMLAEAKAALAPPSPARSQFHNHNSTWADLDRQSGPIEWDWPGWLPHGFLTILASEPGVGKSFLSLRIAASYIDGRPWPDATDFTAEPGKILWCETESGHRVNRQRIHTMGFDPDRIVSPLVYPLKNFQLTRKQHRDALEHHADRADIRLVVLDSLTGLYTNGRQVRANIELVPSLAELAAFVGKPFLVTHQLRQRPTLDRNRRPNLDRLLGSPILARIARVVWVLHAPDPANPDDRCLTVVKNNLAPFPDSIGVRIDAHGPHFGPPSQPPSGVTYSEEERAAEFLKDLLARGPKPATYVKAEAQAAGISATTLKRAKSRLRVKSNKLPDEWYWELPLE